MTVKCFPSKGLQYILNLEPSVLFGAYELMYKLNICSQICFSHNFFSISVQSTGFLDSTDHTSVQRLVHQYKFHTKHGACHQKKRIPYEFNSEAEHSVLLIELLDDFLEMVDFFVVVHGIYLLNKYHR